VLEQIGFIGQDLLHAQRPLLVPGARQTERLIPRRKLHRARTRAFRKGDGEHFEQDAWHVVFRLLLGQSE
jgi:hypothetical protein